MYEELHNKFQSWYDSLTNHDWNRDENNKIINLHCSSEQQAIHLYANEWGHFWNEPLHNKEPVTNFQYKPAHKFDPGINKSKKYEIRGEDYKFLQSALDKAIFPEDRIVYHGVEYMENEFPKQLEPYIKTNNINGRVEYDLSNTINQTITSYGFLSTTFDKNTIVNNYVYGKDWTDNNIEKPPFKVPMMFEINIKKGTRGAAYLAGFPFSYSEQYNHDEQVLINLNSTFKITGTYKKQDSRNRTVYVLKMDLLETNINI